MKKTKLTLLTLILTLATASFSSQAHAQMSPNSVPLIGVVLAKMRAQMITDLQVCLLPEDYEKAKKVLMDKIQAPDGIYRLEKLEERSCAVVATRALKLGFTEAEIRSFIYSRFKIPSKSQYDGESHEGGAHTGFVQQEDTSY
jgi:hypothetical protein